MTITAFKRHKKCTQALSKPTRTKIKQEHFDWALRLVSEQHMFPNVRKRYQRQDNNNEIHILKFTKMLKKGTLRVLISNLKSKIQILEKEPWKHSRRE